MTLYITDMDGTLLGADARISEASRRMLRQLVARDVAVTVATARTPATVQPLLQGTDMHLPCIVMTGAALWHPQTQTYSDLHYMPAELEPVIDGAFARAGIHPFVYTLRDGMPLHVYIDTRDLTNHQQRFVDDRRGLPLKRFYMGVTPPDADRGHRLLHFGMGPWQQVTRLAEELKEKTDCSISCYPDTYTPHLGLIEVFAPGVSKASAVLDLKKKLGADRLEIFGDNLNDLPMLAVADRAIAVANAVPQVRDRANLILDANTTDAVPRYILAQQPNQE